MSSLAALMHATTHPLIAGPVSQLAALGATLVSLVLRLLGPRTCLPALSLAYRLHDTTHSRALSCAARTMAVDRFFQVNDVANRAAFATLPVTLLHRYALGVPCTARVSRVAELHVRHSVARWESGADAGERDCFTTSKAGLRRVHGEVAPTTAVRAPRGCPASMPHACACVLWRRAEGFVAGVGVSQRVERRRAAHPVGAGAVRGGGAMGARG
jgi:hypothetical protein